ncbi:MAG: class I SAM-dependent methyltransferase, partial [Janthinobacterium lividum]
MIAMTAARQDISMHSTPRWFPALARRFARPAIAAVAVFAIATAAGAATLTLEQAVQGKNRSPSFIARDPARHPSEELRFFGVSPTSSVVEIWPGGGYWTEILAPYLHDTGRYTLAVDVPNGEPEGQNFAMGDKFAARLDADPTTFGKVEYTFFGLKHPQLLTPESVDVVLTFRNLHNWVNQFDAEIFLASVHRALKLGGTLGVEDHRGNPHLPQDPKARFGYLRQDYAVRLIEKAGFKLVGASEINANPRDTADYPRGVWTLPPSFALG